MSVTNLAAKRARIDWAKHIRQLIAARDPDAAQAIDQAITQHTQDRFLLTVIGKAKRGKSTLINALLGRSDDIVAPIDRLPASSTISRFVWRPTEQAHLTTRDGRTTPIAYADIRNYVTEELNPGNRLEVAEVLVGGPFVGLEEDLELVDTPGAGSVHSHHDELLHGFLPQSDAVIFMVTAHLPLDSEELKLLAQIRSADIRKVFFAINRADEATPQELAEATAHNRQILATAGLTVGDLHELSAKRAFQGDLATSGLPKLLAEIRGFLAQEKGAVLAERFASRVATLAAPALQALRLTIASAEKSTSQLDHELADLRTQQQKLLAERKFAATEFTTAWGKALGELEHALLGAKQRLHAEVDQLFQGTGLLEVKKLAQELPTRLTRLVDQQLAPLTTSFEQRARAACEKLHAEFPQIGVEDSGRIAVRPKQHHAAVVQSIAGGATAAVGVGVASAGAAAATTLAAANAVALSATATVAAPSVVSGLITSFGSAVGLPGWLGGGLASLTTGTATVAAPGAITATPLWIAMAGPVGWTLAGLGAIAIPLSWRMSRLKQRDQMEQLAHEQVDIVEREFRGQRLPFLRQSATAIVSEFELGLDRQLHQLQLALEGERANPVSPAELTQLQSAAGELHQLLGATPR